MEEKKFVTEHFYHGQLPLNNSPTWGMSLRAAGSMRFRWNEVNENRAAFLRRLAGPKDIAAVELIHSHIVYAVDSIEELNGKQGDGIITTNKNLIPVVTVADCMPIFLFEQKKGVFGVLHSGWKGTGIVQDAIEKSEKVYGTNAEDFHVVMGPHIHDCCYTVDEERAQFFRVNFTPDCVTEVFDSDDRSGIIFAGDPAKGEGTAVEKAPFDKAKKFRLSLAKANLAVLKRIGVNEDNIVVCKDCTCCNPLFGSFRRETMGLPNDMPLSEKQKHFTVQAAWVKW